MLQRKGVTNEMLSNISVKPQTTGRTENFTPNNASPTAETGEFDFMSYLLGLQSEDSETSEGLSLDPNVITTPGKVGQGKEETKEGDALTALFPGMTAPVNPLLSTPEEAPSTEKPVPQSDANENPLPGLSGLIPSSHLAEAKTLEAGTDVSAEETPSVGDSPLVDAAASGPSTETISGLKAFQSQLAANLPLTKKEVRTESQGSVDDIVAPPPANLFTVGSPLEVTGSGGEKAESLTASPDLPELFSRVESLARQGGGTMKVSLNPPELGQVEVEVTARGKEVQIELKSDSSFGKSVLESRLGELRSSMQSQDLVVQRLEVSIDRELARGFSNPNQTMTGNWNQNQQAFSQFSNQSRSFSGDSSPRRQLDVSSTRGVIPRLETVGITQRPWDGRLDVRI